MIIDGKKIAEEVLAALQQERVALFKPIRLGVMMSAGDAATESFIKIKSRAAARLGVEIVREELTADAKTEDALVVLDRLVGEVDGVIVQLPLPVAIEADKVLLHVPPTKDVDAIGPEPRLVLAPVAGAIKEILTREKVNVAGKKTAVIGAGRLVGLPSAMQ
jgi:methylenetetrahydrofolate dehydrogenase (NADP+)/methenyltetrahydrofolate cyclohydrolase